jgi:hypothetical protein
VVNRSKLSSALGLIPLYCDWVRKIEDRAPLGAAHPSFGATAVPAARHISLHADAITNPVSENAAKALIGPVAEKTELIDELEVSVDRSTCTEQNKYRP